MSKFRSKKSFFLLLLTALIVVALLTYFLFLRKNSATQTLTLTHDFTVQIPQSWSIIKRPQQNHVVLTNGQKGDLACYADIFVVKPDRDYSFEQWLGTALTNQVFLKTGKQTTLNEMGAFIGSYSFVDEYFRQNVNHQRIILKNKGVLADLHLTYKTNGSCKEAYQSMLGSLSFK